MATRRRFLQAAGLAGVLSAEHVARAEQASNNCRACRKHPTSLS